MTRPEQAPAGRVESLRFARLLSRFWEEGFSGSFRAQGRAGPSLTISKEILFERGRVAWAASDDPQESIRAYLINRGLLRPEQWRLAQERAGNQHPRRSLLEMGFLSARELQDADRERVSGIILSLFNWSEGDYAITPSPLPAGTPNLKIDPRDLVLEGIMSSGDRDKVLEEIGSLDAVLVVRPDDLVRASLSLPVELVELMAKADGTRTVADICGLSPLSDYMISAAFAGLKALGLATPSDASPSAAPPEPPRASGGTLAARPAPRGLSRNQPAPRSDREPDMIAPRLPLTPEPGDEAAERLAPQSGPAEGSALPSGPGGHVAPEPAAAAPPLVEADLPAAAPAAMDDDPGTQPMVATPPGGTPAVTDSRNAPPPDDDDSGTRPMVSTPPGGFRVDEAPETAIEDREGETEIVGGIPVGGSSSEGSPDEGLQPEEIENVVRIFASGDEETPAQPAAPRTGHDEAGDPGDSASFQEDEGPADEYPGPELQAGDGQEEEGAESGGQPPMEDAPTWIYEPSGDQQTVRSRARWVKWAGIAAGIFAIGTVVALFFGGGSDGVAEPAGRATAQAGPPAVEVPPTPPGTESPTAVAETPTAPEAAPEHGAATPPPAPPAERQPSAERPVAAASTQAPPPVAPAAAGDILRSGPFGDSRGLLGKGRYAEAARGFQSSLSGKDGLYTVQLALACSADTVARAVKSSRGAKEFFILPREFHGRACYRLVWGAYPGRAAAEKGRTSVPSVWLKDKHPPFIAPL